MKSAADAWAERLATGLGAGYLPVAPGTWGSLQAVVLAVLAEWAAPGRAWTSILAMTLFFSVVGVWAAGRTAVASGDEDPSKVVIDEIAGQLLCFLWIPLSGASLLVGFLLFRAFDIVKPPPARQSESLPGGWGIMADDWIAGVYAGAVLAALHHGAGWL